MIGRNKGARKGKEGVKIGRLERQKTERRGETKSEKHGNERQRRRSKLRKK
jgi:hypothetical protein